MPQQVSITKTPWLNPRDWQFEASLNLFCLPYAGGGAGVFREWRGKFAPSIGMLPVQLPGRETRISESSISDSKILVGTMADGLKEALHSRPFALFGHSMGAELAFELARECRRRQWPAPLHLFVSGRRPPHKPGDDPKIYQLPDAEFEKELIAMGGLPPEIVEHRDLMSLVLPILRADFTLCDTHLYVQEPPVNFPISVFGGTDDPETDRDSLEAWAELTAGAHKLRILPGDHFYVNSRRSEVIQAMAEDLAAYLR